MFYKTQIKSVTDYGVIDTAGRPLFFIGYLPVKAGDSVFTDGKFIFGNAPPKGSPAVFDEQSGIPVLADTLRGYFSNRGKYKKYYIKGDDWILNSLKNYFHDNGELNIIDADIALDNEGNETGFYSVEKKVSQLDEDDDDFHWGFYQQAGAPTDGGTAMQEIVVQLPTDDFSSVRGFQAFDWGGDHYDPHYVHVARDADFSTNGYYPAFLGIDSATYQATMKRCFFYLHGVDIHFRFSDDDIIKNLQFLIRKNGEVIQIINTKDLLNDFVLSAKADVDFFPNRESVKHCKARALFHNFKILPNGSWQLLLETEIWASNTFFQHTEDYDHSADTVEVNEVPNRIFSTVSHNIFLLKFSGNINEDKIVSETVSQWKFLYPLALLDNYFGEYYFVLNQDDGYHASVREDTDSGYIETSFVYAGRYGNLYLFYTKYLYAFDARLADTSILYDTPQSELAESFSFPVQDNFHALLKPVDNDFSKWYLAGFFDDNDKPILENILPDDTDAHNRNFSFLILKNGDFLFGFHDGDLYKFHTTNNMLELLDSGLRNFRLRTLKKINKAKR